MVPPTLTPQPPYRRNYIANIWCLDSIPTGFGWIQKLSIFHYAFEALIVNEMRYLTLFEQKFGLSVEVPGAAILRIFGFDALGFWSDVGGLSAIFGIYSSRGNEVANLF